MTYTDECIGIQAPCTSPKYGAKSPLSGFSASCNSWPALAVGATNLPTADNARF